MAQNVTIAGASYPDVPGIDVPKTGGGTARFVDTSDANAAAGDISRGKTAYVNGTKLTGTNDGEGSSGGDPAMIVPVTLPASLLETKTATVTMESGTAAQIAAALAAEKQVYLKGVLSNTEQDDGADIVLDLTVFIPVQMMQDVDVEVGGETVTSFVNLVGASFMSGYKVTFLYDETQGDNTGNAEIFHFAAVDDADLILPVTVVLTESNLTNLNFTIQQETGTWERAMQAFHEGRHVEMQIAINAQGYAINVLKVPLCRAELDTSAYMAAYMAATANEEEPPSPQPYYALQGEAESAMDIGLLSQAGFSYVIHTAWNISLTTDDTLTLAADPPASINVVDFTISTALTDDITIDGQTVADIKEDEDVDAIYLLAADGMTAAATLSLFQMLSVLVWALGFKVQFRFWRLDALAYSIEFSAYTSTGVNGISAGIERQAWLQATSNAIYLFTRGGGLI